MEQQKVDMFIMSNGKYLPSNKVGIVRERLLSMDDSRWGALSTIQFKSSTTALILSLFLGQLGVDRFYIGKVGLGVLKLLTLGLCGIWVIIDWFLISGATKEANYTKLQTYLY